MRFLQTAGLVLLTLALGGCFQSSTVLRVKADGSGTIEQRTVFTRAAMAQLKQLAGFSGGQPSPDLLSEDQARALAANLGPGVTFVKSTPVSTETMEGRDSVYAFPDINQLRISQRPTAPGGVGLRADSLGPPQTITFALEAQPDGNELLRIRMPNIQQLPGLPVQLTGASGANRPGQTVTDEQIASARQMFAGMRLTVAVEPAGRIVQTSSPYVDGNRVTLFDLDFDQLVTDPDALRSLQLAKTPDEVKTALKTVPGLKFATDREIVIEFAGGK